MYKRKYTTKREDGSYTLKRGSTIPLLSKILGEYEDLEEQGRLLILPCKIGDPVFVIQTECEDIYIPESHYYIVEKERFELDMIEDFGRYVFLTEAEAYRAMKKMQEGE